MGRGRGGRRDGMHFLSTLYQLLQNSTSLHRHIVSLKSYAIANASNQIGPLLLYDVQFFIKFGNSVGNGFPVLSPRSIPSRNISTIFPAQLSIHSAVQEAQPPLYRWILSYDRPFVFSQLRVQRLTILRSAHIKIKWSFCVC